MMKILDLIDDISRKIGKTVSILAYFAAAFIVYEIIMRYLLNKPTLWVTEGSVFVCGLLYLLGGSWCLLEDRHVRVDILYSHLSNKGKAIIDCLTYPFFFIYIAVMIFASSKYAWASVGLSETTMSPWDPPIWPMKVAMMLAFVLLFIQGFARFLRNVYLILNIRRLP